jgi:transposase-like protein
MLRDIDWLFNGRHFDREVIVLCVRWHLRYKLSLRDLVEMMAERGLSLSHTTIMRWVKRFTPEFVKRWDRLARSAGRSWRVDETYGTCALANKLARTAWAIVARQITFDASFSSHPL